MIKITLEVSEDFIRENASAENTTDKLLNANGISATRFLLNYMSFVSLENEIENGKTEFVITPDKLDYKLMQIYNNNIGEICALAAFSETDNKEKE